MMAQAVSHILSRARAGDDLARSLTGRLEEAQNKIKEAEEKAKKAESELSLAKERTQEIESEYALSQSALRSSEAQAADLTSELKGKGREIDLLKLKLQQAEEREKKAVERAKTVVEDFRQSAEYQDELAEEAVDGLIRGFEDFREQVAQFCPEIDFGRFQPRLGSDENQDLPLVEGLENVTSEVAPPTFALGVASGGVEDPTPEVVPEAVVKANLEVTMAAVPEVAAVLEVAAAPEVATTAAPVADPSSSTTKAGDRV